MAPPIYFVFNALGGSIDVYESTICFGRNCKENDGPLYIADSEGHVGVGLSPRWFCLDCGCASN